MKPVVPGGFLVAVEGIDGAGKTTVSALLAQYCGERGLACTYSKEPTSLRFGRQLRESARSGRLGSAEELELFLNDRKDHASRSLRPALEFGAIVILDRYYWSTAAYQGARGIDPAEILAANEAHVPRPDLVVLLDVPPGAGLDRVKVRGDIPNEFEKAQALARAREIFLDLHHAGSAGPSVCIDASQPLRAVHTHAQQAFQNAIRTTITTRISDSAAQADALASFDA